jgi:nicotinamidase-related amidase
MHANPLRCPAALLLLAAALAAPAAAQEGKPRLFDTSDAVVLLLDHQTGLFQTVKDIPVDVLRRNTASLAEVAELLKVPVITTTSEPKGPNGPLMEELATSAPNAVYVPRKGEISAWENADFVKAVEATGRKTLIMAGVWTSVCVVFPAIQAKAAGYEVYAVIDASGDVSEMASAVSVARLAQAGVVPTTTNAVVSELQRTWNRPDAAKFAELYGKVVPNYQAAIESYRKAQEVAREPGR